MGGFSDAMGGGGSRLRRAPVLMECVTLVVQEKCGGGGPGGLEGAAKTLGSWGRFVKSNIPSGESRDVPCSSRIVDVPVAEGVKKAGWSVGLLPGLTVAELLERRWCTELGAEVSRRSRCADDMIYVQ